MFRAVCKYYLLNCLWPKSGTWAGTDSIVYSLERMKMCSLNFMSTFYVT